MPKTSKSLQQRGEKVRKAFTMRSRAGPVPGPRALCPQSLLRAGGDARGRIGAGARPSCVGERPPASQRGALRSAPKSHGQPGGCVEGVSALSVWGTRKAGPGARPALRHGVGRQTRSDSIWRSARAGWRRDGRARESSPLRHRPGTLAAPGATDHRQPFELRIVPGALGGDEARPAMEPPERARDYKNTTLEQSFVFARHT